ncbi:bifunctional 2',3'-cyclic-nucleotide 2'-phosphodiesterase/3'-nucleotidase [Deinococcus radiophilus]|nr:bifunctional 2',3'-cyclic-nucleotide 2'-phosphodiesterase/3'-nucleotidase [Deinococcus radiophilus]UFA51841.1 bifunctional 2',3'-cyclic-nucleotide 2'-phosphodiesterase/3'-nucleotidase [Deinococcus radiophilus]
MTALLSLLAAAQAQTAQLRILGTTDLHMAALGYDYYQDKVTGEYGLENVATLMREARAEVPGVLLVDNGDTLQGNPLGDYVARIKPLVPGEVHPMLATMGGLGYSAMALGNHEFNYGLDFLDQVRSTSPFPLLNANVRSLDGQARFQPYVIRPMWLRDSEGKVRVVRVGITAFTPPQILQWDKAHLEGKVEVMDMVEAARQVVPQMQAEGADLIVALAHTGIGGAGAGGEAAAAALTQVPGIDAVISGHSHAEFPSQAYADIPGVNLERGTINGIPVVMPGSWGSHLGVVDLNLTYDAAAQDWRVSSAQGSLRRVWDKAGKVALVQPDPQVAASISPAHQGALTYVRSKVADLSAPVSSYWALVQDDPSVQLVNNAQIAYVKAALADTEYADLPVLGAAAPFKAGGRMGVSYYTDIPAGELAIRSVADLYVYPNTVQAVVVSGNELREWLERSAGQFNQITPGKSGPQALVDTSFPTFNFDVIDGVTYRIDVSQPSRYGPDGKVANPDAHRIVDLAYQGQPVRPDQRFVVATNNYRAGGGGGFPGLTGENVILRSPDETRQALISYFEAQGTVNPTADGNWSLVPVPGARLQVFTSPAGAPTAPAQAKRVGDAEGGFAEYVLTLE